MVAQIKIHLNACSKALQRLNPREKLRVLISIKLVKYLQLILLFCLMVGVGGVYFLQSKTLDTPQIYFSNTPPKLSPPFARYAYIQGAVKEPGVYEIDAGTRLFELIGMAGGFTQGVNTEEIAKQINMAKILADEEHIFIPYQSTDIQPKTKSPGGLVNINTAAELELISLPGVGEKLAKDIISARPFKSIEGLLNVSGIGDAKFASIKDLVKVDD